MSTFNKPFMVHSETFVFRMRRLYVPKKESGHLHEVIGTPDFKTISAPESLYNSSVKHACHCC